MNAISKPVSRPAATKARMRGTRFTSERLTDREVQLKPLIPFGVGFPEHGTQAHQLVRSLQFSRFVFDIVLNALAACVSLVTNLGRHDLEALRGMRVVAHIEADR